MRHFDERIMNFAFVVDGERATSIVQGDQEGNVPYIITSEDISIIAAGEDVTVDVSSNVEWDYTLSNDSWLTEKEIHLRTPQPAGAPTADENVSVDEGCDTYRDSS
ncbi:MAG: hypothetical protein R2744_08335 [Bacteroidales bacterium]